MEGEARPRKHGPDYFPDFESLLKPGNEDGDLRLY